MVHVYTGDGKGKTTCAFGLAVRCAGNGCKVKIIQFLKTDDSGEVNFLKDMENIQVYRFEMPHGFICDMSDFEKESAKEQITTALRFTRFVLESGECDMLVLDEVICAYNCGFASEEQLSDLIDCRKSTEIVFTGRNAPDWLLKKSNYVTCMEMIKHPYNKMIEARKGIEF